MSLYLPAIGAVNVTMRLKRAQAVGSSPFTYSQQVYEHQGTCWEMDYTMPPLSYAEARSVEAFLMKAKGRSVPFFAGNPLHTSTALVELTGAVSVRDTSITCTGDEVYPGTYFQLGNHLYMCTEYFTGSGDMQIEPPMREDLSLEHIVDYGLVTDTDTSQEDYGWAFEADADTIDYGLVTDNNNRSLDFATPRCLFRMAAPDFGWSVDVAQMHSFTFTFTEAL